VEGLKSNAPHLYSSLKECIPALKDEFSIEIKLENKLLETDLFQRKVEMLGFLRSRLDNYKVDLTVKVEENSRKKRPYTDKDKFEQMASKNPALLKLKDELDLEIDY